MRRLRTAWAAAAGTEPRAPDPAAARRRAVWLKRLHLWHWVSSALCLSAMLLFTITGITLNHAGEIEARPVVTTREATLPEALRAGLAAAPAAGDAALPPAPREWLAAALQLEVSDEPAEWSADEIYLALPRPGGDAWLRVDRASGRVEAEITDRGWIAWVNDLHKGRHTGAAWRGFIDLFAAACLVFCATGLAILQLHAGRRPATWPVIALGLAAPLLLAALFIH